MTLSNDDRIAIINYRIDRAHATLEELDYVIEGKFWNLAANRLIGSCRGGSLPTSV